MNRSQFVTFVRQRGLAVVATHGPDGAPQAALVGIATTDQVASLCCCKFAAAQCVLTRASVPCRPRSRTRALAAQSPATRLSENPRPRRPVRSGSSVWLPDGGGLTLYPPVDLEVCGFAVSPAAVEDRRVT